jgi:hypothetical protein
MQLAKGIDVGDRVTAQQAAKTFGLYHRALVNAIDAGNIPGTLRVELGTRCNRYIDLAALETHLQGLPRCAFVAKDGTPCDRPVTVAPGSVACKGPHARAIETKGKSWRTREAIEKSAAGIRGKPRPDIAPRLAEMHAEPLKRQAWHYNLVVGRKLAPKTQRDRKLALVGVINALAGKLGRVEVELDDAVVAEVRRLADRGIGRKEIAGRLGISERQVRKIRAL